MTNVPVFLAVLALALAKCTTQTPVPEPKPSQPVPVSSIQSSLEQGSIGDGSRFTADGIESKVGIVSMMNDDHLCVRGLNASLKAGDELSLITPYEKPHVITKISIGRKMATSCVDDDSDIGDEEEIIKNTSYYSATPVGVTEDYQILSGFAILDPLITPKLEKGIATAELVGGSPTEYFRACASNEGVHFTVWAGKPLVGKRIWHRYYYLKYDTEPTCKKKDYED